MVTDFKKYCIAGYLSNSQWKLKPGNVQALVHSFASAYFWAVSEQPLEKDKNLNLLNASSSKVGFFSFLQKLTDSQVLKQADISISLTQNEQHIILGHFEQNNS